MYSFLGVFKAHSTSFMQIRGTSSYTLAHTQPFYNCQIRSKCRKTECSQCLSPLCKVCHYVIRGCARTTFLMCFQKIDNWCFGCAGIATKHVLTLGFLSWYAHKALAKAPTFSTWSARRMSGLCQEYFGKSLRQKSLYAWEKKQQMFTAQLENLWVNNSSRVKYRENVFFIKIGCPNILRLVCT